MSNWWRASTMHSNAWIVAATYMVVIFSILVQALTMGRLVRHLNRDATLEPPGQKS